MWHIGALIGLLGVTNATSVAAEIGEVPSSTSQRGDLYLSTGNGSVEQRTTTGTLVRTLTSGVASADNTGSAFDTSGNLYVTEFQADRVTKFNSSGQFAGSFGSGYDSHPSSIVFDAAGNAFVGQADGSRTVLKFDPTGAPLASFTPATEDRGTDWIDLLPDNCTLRYASEGTSLKQFNVCTNTQMADFATGLPGDNAYAHHHLADGSALIADANFVVRVDASGAVTRTYTPAESFTLLEALALDPDGTSFWTADLFTGVVFHFDLASGTELGSFATGHTVTAISVGGSAPVGVEQTITFGALGDAALSATPVVATASSSSGLPVVFTTTTPLVCTAGGVHGETITLLALGTCTVHADQAGDSSFNAATTVVQSFNVTKNPQTITFSALGDVVLSSGPVTAAASASSGLPVVFTSSTPLVCTTGGGAGATVTLLAPGVCTINADQAGNTTFASAPTVTQSFTISPESTTTTSTTTVPPTTTSTSTSTTTTVPPTTTSTSTSTTTTVPPTTTSTTTVPARSDQTITVGAISDVALAQGSLTASASASSGLPVTFTSSTPLVCATGGPNGATITLLAPGICTISADQGGDASFNAAPTVVQSFTVLANAQTITFAVLSDVVLPQPSVTASATASSGLPVVFTTSTPGVCVAGGPNGATITLLAVGTCTVNADQLGDGTFAPAPTVTQSFRVSPEPTTTTSTTTSTTTTPTTTTAPSTTTTSTSTTSTTTTVPPTTTTSTSTTSTTTTVPPTTTTVPPTSTTSVSTSTSTTVVCASDDGDDDVRHSGESHAPATDSSADRNSTSSTRASSTSVANHHDGDDDDSCETPTSSTTRPHVTTTTRPRVTTTTRPRATTTTARPPVSSTTTTAPCPKPGWGYDDRHHGHCGPPGLLDRIDARFVAFRSQLPDNSLPIAGLLLAVFVLTLVGRRRARRNE